MQLFGEMSGELILVSATHCGFAWDKRHGAVDSCARGSPLGLVERQ
jgi:hypothetical protein